MTQTAQTPLLSIVLPTLNAAAHLARTLAAIERSKRAFACEIILADGGSSDGTVDIAHRFDAEIVTAGSGEAPGRGGQLRKGAARARGTWLFFLHADSEPAPQWAEAIAAFIGEPENAGKAAAFRFALASDAAPARRLEKIVAWRCRVFGLPYGDQGLLLSRALYDAVGGFASLAIMEDVEFVRRLGRARLHMFDVALVTSAERYERDGYWRRPLRNLFCLTLYFLGMPSRQLRRFYG